MARERLTQKTAETLLSKPGTSVEEKDSGIPHDVYTMNNPEHEKNDPKKDEYVIGDPSKFGEDVNKDNLWKKDEKSRDQKTNHPLNPDYPITKSAAEAIKQAKQLEEKAVKCIIASQRILPGAPDGVLEEQATDLMYLPLQAVNAMLTRQEKLAMMIGEAADAATKTAAKKDEEKEEEEEKKPEGESCEDKEAGKIPEGLKKFQEEQKAGKKPEDTEEDKEAGKIPEGLKKFQEEQKDGKKPEDEAKEGKKEEKDPLKDMEEKLSAMTAEFEKMKADMNKGKEEKPEDADKVKEARNQEKNDAFYTGKGLSEKEQTEGEKGKAKEATEVEANDSLIDDIFNSVMASDEKKGAKTLTGLVKKEASDGSGLGDGVNLWGAPPDISQHFDTRA
jgi:hypothetical protein